MIVAELTGDVQTDYYYDESGNVFGFKRGNSEYYYIRNGQGDIIGILDSSGTQIVSYVYDSWGKLVSISGSQAETIGEANPFRYRGYYYDTETGLYYLNSRYYDPEVGRWINADDPGIIDGANDHILENNLFAYCFNNPINMEDQTGLWPDWIKKAAGAVKDFASSNVGKIVIGAAAIGVGVIATVATGGAAAPALIGGIKAACIAGGISAGISATTTAVKSAASGDSLKTVLKKSAGAAVYGFADRFMTGGIMAGASQVASAGFKTAAKFGVKSGNKSGIQIGKNAKILSPDQPWHKNNGGTLIKIGNIRIDVGSNTLLHMHLPGVFSRVHLPIGTIGAGIYGGVKR